jgi:hypothetical protein
MQDVSTSFIGIERKILIRLEDWYSGRDSSVLTHIWALKFLELLLRIVSETGTISGVYTLRKNILGGERQDSFLDRRSELPFGSSDYRSSRHLLFGRLFRGGIKEDPKSDENI